MRPTVTHWYGAALFAISTLLFPIAINAQTRPAPVAADDPFARRGWNLEITGHGAAEMANYNGSHEDMLALITGVTYGVGKGITIKIESPLYYVWQRGTDAYIFGVTAGARGRILRRPRWSLFWEVEVGVSDADTYVPPRGTRFNYLAVAGGGTTVRLGPGVHALMGLRWVHVSNNGLAGRSRNPDIEAVGPMAGMLIGF
jgi:lipid A 3-O-deacylase